MSILQSKKIENYFPSKSTPFKDTALNDIVKTDGTETSYANLFDEDDANWELNDENWDIKTPVIVDKENHISNQQNPVNDMKSLLDEDDDVFKDLIF